MSNVAGVIFDNVTMQEAVARVLFMAQRKDRPRYVCTGNLDHLRLANEDPDFNEAYCDASLVVADGKPVVWLSKLQHHPLKERVAGVDLFWETCRAAWGADLRIFLLGGMPGSADATKRELERRYPGIEIVGTMCPPKETFDSPGTQKEIKRRVRDSRAHILFVAFGAPKQEKWIAKNVKDLHVPVTMGVGGTFEMVAGTVKRAPKWVQNVGLEWLYRFFQEPRRLFSRYFMKDMPFLLKATARTLAQR